MNTFTKIFAALALGGIALGAGVIIYRRVNNKSFCDKKILFIGDSTTAGDSSYADRLRQDCPGIRIKKLAKVGEKTDWMLDQWTEEKENHKYDIVSVLAGSNDIFARLSIEKAKQNLQRIYDEAKATGAKVVAITPPNKSFYTPTTDKHKRLIAELTEWIGKNKSVDVFIDLGALSNDRNLFASDMQHLNSTGQKMLKDEFYKRVR